uniref:Uncharacterized protein n=1 Tax=Panagrolaimus sp. JU765 TaxID=591449 RepID=A0AC34Q621_9BILA
MNVEQSEEHLSSEWNNDYERTCLVCEAPSNGYHFNAPSCSACAAFFRRTVTLNRHFECSHDNACKINYVMRVICRACRYKKCIEAGMDRRAVQPRRDSILGRRKIKYNPLLKHIDSSSPNLQNQVTTYQNEDNSFVFIDSNTEVPRIYATRSNSLSSASSTSSSLNCEALHAQTRFPQLQENAFSQTAATSPDGFHYNHQKQILSPFAFSSKPILADTILEKLVSEEIKANDRRKILYCDCFLDELLSEKTLGLPYVFENLRPLKFTHIRKEIRTMILISFEWLRSWDYFSFLPINDKKVLLRKYVLYQNILDPAYLTTKMGYPDKFVMTNGMYVSMSDESNTGWEDEPEISSETKTMIYKPLMKRIITQIIEPMRELDLKQEEYCVLKALVVWKDVVLWVSATTKTLLNKETEALFASLNNFYVKQGFDDNTIARRMGGLILLLSNVFSVGMECIEDHQKIEFFNLWELDKLLIKLLKVR